MNMRNAGNVLEDDASTENSTFVQLVSKFKHLIDSNQLFKPQDRQMSAKKRLKIGSFK